MLRGIDFASFYDVDIGGVWLGFIYGVSRHFQQYFSYIVVVSFGGRNRILILDIGTVLFFFIDFLDPL